MKKGLLTLAAISAFLVLSFSVLLAQEYEIRLSRKAKVGDQYRVLSTGYRSVKTTVFVGDAAVKNTSDEFTVELVSSMKALEINESGRVTKIAIRIEKCLVTTHGETRVLLPTGVIVIGSLEGKKIVYTIDDVPVDPMTAKALGTAIASHGGGPTDDEIFGTREKKRVGDTWGVNADLLAKSLSEMANLLTRKEDIDGTATLEGVVTRGSPEYLVVSASLNIGNFSVPLPDGFRIQSGQMRGTFSGRFPINQARVRFGQSAQMLGRFTAVGSPDPKIPEMTIQGAIELRRTSEIEHLE